MFLFFLKAQIWDYRSAQNKKKINCKLVLLTLSVITRSQRKLIRSCADTSKLIETKNMYCIYHVVHWKAVHFKWNIFVLMIAIIDILCPYRPKKLASHITITKRWRWLQPRNFNDDCSDRDIRRITMMELGGWWQWWQWWVCDNEYTVVIKYNDGT